MKKNVFAVLLVVFAFAVFLECGQQGYANKTVMYVNDSMFYGAEFCCKHLNGNTGYGRLPMNSDSASLIPDSPLEWVDINFEYEGVNRKAHIFIKSDNKCLISFTSKDGVPQAEIKWVPLNSFPAEVHVEKLNLMEYLVMSNEDLVKAVADTIAKKMGTSYVVHVTDNVCTFAPDSLSHPIFRLSFLSDGRFKLVKYFPDQSPENDLRDATDLFDNSDQMLRIASLFTQRYYRRRSIVFYSVNSVYMDTEVTVESANNNVYKGFFPKRKVNYGSDPWKDMKVVDVEMQGDPTWITVQYHVWDESKKTSVKRTSKFFVKYEDAGVLNAVHLLVSYNGLEPMAETLRHWMVLDSFYLKYRHARPVWEVENL